MKNSEWRKWAGVNGNPRRIRALNSRLDKIYGPFKPFRKMDGVEELIVTVLSQNTNDVNRDRAYKNLRSKFPTWDEILKAPQKDVEDAIRVGGLAHNKSIAIKKILSELKNRYGKFTVDPIVKLPIRDALDELKKLPGVGTKTAACVLVFSYGKPVIPVDTHVHRLSRRLGLAVEKASPDQVFEVLMEIVPDDIKYSFHVFIIRHGRNICHSRNPRCPECSLSDLCPSANL